MLIYLTKERRMKKCIILLPSLNANAGFIIMTYACLLLLSKHHLEFRLARGARHSFTSHLLRYQK
jgi:hypothetical protein